MRSVNEVTLLGNVGQDPKITTTKGGTVIANLSLATNYKVKDKDPVTEWHRVVAFKRSAEIIRDYVVKGSKLYIKGQLQTRSWEKDGEKRYTTEIVVRDISLLDNRAADSSKKAALKGSTNDSADPEITDEDIPF